MAARVASETVKSARNEAQAEANKQTRRRRVRPRDGEYFVTPMQIQEVKDSGGPSRPRGQAPAQLQASIADNIEYDGIEHEA
jgi:hypothetical protein